jgi:glutamate-1-semialdehyde aminotransferase
VLNESRVAGVTSTGSKRPEALFGREYHEAPHRMQRSAGARVWDENGIEYLDFVMALGAVALGYGHPDVNRAVHDAVERGAVGPLPPVEEAVLAEELARRMPLLDSVRFLKTGAEAVAAAVRLARVHTGRDLVLGSGYHGWLDWCSRGEGIPEVISALYAEVPFNDPEGTRAAIRRAGDRLAAVVVEPVFEAAPSAEWLSVLRDETHRIGAVLVFDEIKTAFRVARGGASARWGGEPDLVVLGKALANGFPLAAVGGRADIMRGVGRTWISSTLATDFVALAAAQATLATADASDLPGHLGRVGSRLLSGLGALAAAYPGRVRAVKGIPELCYLQFVSEEESGRVARAAARRGLLFKRTAYNFVSLAHRENEVQTALDILDDVLRGKD